MCSYGMRAGLAQSWFAYGVLITFNLAFTVRYETITDRHKEYTTELRIQPLSYMQRTDCGMLCCKSSDLKNSAHVLNQNLAYHAFAQSEHAFAGVQP